MTTFPLVQELHPVPDVFATLQKFSGWNCPILLESALQRPPLGRFSFLSADPVETVQITDPDFGSDPFQALKEQSCQDQAEHRPELPPFQGGWAGLMSYELGRCWERLPRPASDPIQMPALWAGCYDWVLCWDHLTRRAWIVSQGLPESDPQSRLERAQNRLQQVREQLQSPPPALQAPPTPCELPQHFPLLGHPEVFSNFSREDYLRAVQNVIDSIAAGDIFQANLSQQLLAPLRQHPLALYGRLRKCNPAPFAGYLAVEDWAVASASPERFLQVDGQQVSTRPIKGTRRRQRTPEADLFTQDELLASEKDIAENVMIVDLLRNDLSRVCEAGSISVPQLCQVETYETVQHLVSEIRGVLRPKFSVWDLFAATFPGGSITGAPKIRAMEIITELEQRARGSYCGSFFYAGFNGQMDSNILIRTFCCRRGWVQCPVGGGIVADSQPMAEYEETLHKAAGMLQALSQSDPIP